MDSEPSRKRKRPDGGDHISPRATTAPSSPSTRPSEKKRHKALAASDLLPLGGRDGQVDGLTTLPPELLCAVCTLLAPGDVLALGLTCRSLTFVLGEDVAVWRPLLLHRWALEGTRVWCGSGSTVCASAT
jgi:hypothetical protein